MCSKQAYRECESKARYHNEYEADRAANKFTETRGQALYSYQCSQCDGYHLTKVTPHSLSEEIRHMHQGNRRQPPNSQPMKLEALPVPIRSRYSPTDVEVCYFSMSKGFSVTVIRTNGVQDQWIMASPNKWSLVVVEKEGSRHDVAC